MAQVFGAGVRFKKAEPVYELSYDWVSVLSLGVPRYGGATFVYGDYLYIVGGITARGVTTLVERVYLKDFSRAYVAPLPAGRAFFSHGLVDSKFYVLGGIDVGSTPTNTIFVYDVIVDSWSTLTVTLPKKIAWCSSAVLNGKIYVIGGQDDEGNILNTTYEFNPTNNTVSAKALLNRARQNHACATLGGKIYCFGGDDGSSNLNSIESYDPSTNTWTVLDITLPEALTGLVAIPIVIEDKNYILILGG